MYNYYGFKLYDSNLAFIGGYGTFGTKNGGGRVYSVIPLDDGSLVVGGEFTDAEGVDSQLFAKYDSNGVFQAQYAGSGTNMVPWINGRWVSGAVDIDASKFMVFGQFNELRGSNVNNIAYINK